MEAPCHSQLLVPTPQVNHAVEHITHTAPSHPQPTCAAHLASCRFRRVAGLHWMQHQKGRMLRQFHPDGSITAPSKDLLWLQHEEV